MGRLNLKVVVMKNKKMLRNICSAFEIYKVISFEERICISTLNPNLPFSVKLPLTALGNVHHFTLWLSRLLFCSITLPHDTMLELLSFMLASAPGL